jgi:PAS domain S-box-containing protein
LAQSYADPCLQAPYLESFRQGRITQHADIYDGSVNPCAVKFLEQLQVRANLVVPIRRQNYLWGLLIAHQCGSTRQWQPLEIDLLKNLTTQLGIALHQAELHQQLQDEITERKRTEQSLRKNQAQLQQQLAEIEAIYQTAPIGLSILDADLRFIRINQRLAEINGLPIEAHLGRSLRELLPDLANAAEQILRPIIETGEPRLNVEMEGETPAQPGVQRNWLEHFLPLKDNGKTIGISIVCEETTEQKRIEQEREQILSRERAAREAAERANRIKDEFLAVLSHELRTPLNPILGWAKLLQVSQLGPEKVSEALISIERNAKLLNQLIEDLLDLAGILQGQLKLQVAPVDLAEVIQSAVETVKLSADNKEISLQTKLSSIRKASGDSGRLQQIVWNILSNAIKFTPRGGQVNLSLEQVEDLALITVSDTGKGISPEFLPHIFESFIQEDYSITRQYGGLGLGLAIVRQLVEAHGGTITATSQGKGTGATFSVYLPLVTETIQTQPNMPTSKTTTDLQGSRILVVDDEPDICTLLTVLLSHYGATVMAVNSAAEVLAALPTFQPDFLVNDIGLPDVDGYRLIQQIRALPSEQLSQIPAIALTAYARDEDKQRALDSGYQLHLTKPVEPEQLLEAIISVLNSRS